VKKLVDTFSLITLMFIIIVFTAALFLAAAAALVVTILSLEVDPAQLSE
jgi:hypothetical protein